MIKVNLVTKLIKSSTKPFNNVVLATSLSLLSLSLLSLSGCSHLTSVLNSTNEIDNNELANVDNTITLTQITKDISYLASDQLKGRGNFSKEINQAGDYIATRFAEVGLIAPEFASNYTQSYQIQQMIPTTLTVEINGQQIANEALSMATTITDFSWSTTNVENNQAVNIVSIGKNDNMRKALSELNSQGGQHLVLLHPKHEQSFKRYQSYFARGSTKLVDSKNKKNIKGGTIVIALTDISQVKRYTVSGYSRVMTTELNNIVGILPGKSKANEVVLYSAHYDHLGVISGASSNTPLQSNEIYNGADDDASGVSAIINLAHHFAKANNNERTLMFTAFSAEELGGFGSRYFSTHITPESITAMINIEMIGKPAIFGEGTVWMTGMDHSSLGEQLNTALAPQYLKIYADPYPNENLFYRSDNATLARLGVPAHSFSSTQLDKDLHYHQVSDDITSLNLPSMLQVIKTLATATTPLVDGSVTPTRIDTKTVDHKGLIY